MLLPKLTGGSSLSIVRRCWCPAACACSRARLRPAPPCRFPAGFSRLVPGSWRQATSRRAGVECDTVAKRVARFGEHAAATSLDVTGQSAMPATSCDTSRRDLLIAMSAFALARYPVERGGQSFRIFTHFVFRTRDLAATASCHCPLCIICGDRVKPERHRLHILAQST